jgi:putative transposase
MVFVMGLGTFLRALFSGSAGIALENMALGHQLLVLQRSAGRPRLAQGDRIFWVWLSRLWASWRSSLVIVQPATVLAAWHRKGFRLYWRWKYRPNPVGRPRLDAELRDLIRRMARENPPWGRRRSRAELALLGYEVAELTVLKYMHRTLPRPSPTWRAFLTAHARDIVGIDFFVVPTITFHLLFVFVVLRHHRCELLHVNVTDHPSAVWTARQVIETFPEETSPKYLLRDRDSIYGEAFTRRVHHMGILRQPTYTPRHAAYDLRKLRGKGLVERVGTTRRPDPVGHRSGSIRSTCTTKTSNRKCATPSARWASRRSVSSFLYMLVAVMA